MNIEIVSKEDAQGKGQIVEHHIKYEDIHGEEKTTSMTMSEHIRLHKRLRKEGKCNIPVEELTKASIRSSHRKRCTNKFYCFSRKNIDKRAKQRVLSIN